MTRPAIIVAKGLGIVAALVVAAIVFIAVAYPTLTLRYRLTLEAEVDGQPKIGSGVIEVSYGKQPRVGDGSSLRIGCRGEAVVLDLGDRGTLFALLRAGSDVRSIPELIVLRAYGFDGGAFPTGTVEDGQKQLRHLSGKRNLPLTSLPLLVRFRDLHDMRSVESVDPRDISWKFGAGAKLVRASVEVVSAVMWPLTWFDFMSEPLTTGIVNRLPWWNGPFPWIQPVGGGVGIDTRTETFKVGKQDFKRG